MFCHKVTYATKELVSLLHMEAHTSIARRAKRENWQSRPRKGRGGGHDWLISSMPEHTRQTIATAIATKLAQNAASTSFPSLPLFTVNTLKNIPEAKRERAGARALLVSMAREFAAVTGLPRTTAYEGFCYRYNTNAIEVLPWVRTLISKVCRASLINWETSIHAKGLGAVADKYGQHRKGKGVIDATTGMADRIIAEIIEFYDISAASIMDSLEAYFQGQRLPTLRNLQRWIQQYRTANPQLIKKIQNPDGWRSTYMAAGGSASEAITRINQM